MIPILYEDQDLVVVHKPPGVLVHRTLLDKHETTSMLQLVRDQIGKKVYPVHRLDKPTSGVLIFALNSEMARVLSENFSSQSIRKEYLAIVRGYAPDQVLIDHAIVEKKDPIADRLAQKNPTPQEAQTEVRTLSKTEISEFVDKYPQTRYSLVWARPLTGRKHQIRRHLGHINHPIVGDVEHGKSVHNRYFEKRFGWRRLYLHAMRVRLVHPKSQKELSFEAPLEERFLTVLKELNLWNESVEKSLRSL